MTIGIRITIIYYEYVEKIKKMYKLDMAITLEYISYIFKKYVMF